MRFGDTDSDDTRAAGCTTFAHGSQHPRGPPVIVPPSKTDNFPAAPKAVAGLRVDLPGRHDAFVYRYRSHQIALAAAPSFLSREIRCSCRAPRITPNRRTRSGGVSGCGAQIWFTDSRQPEASAWERSVQATLRKGDPACSKQMFGVVA